MFVWRTGVKAMRPDKALPYGGSIDKFTRAGERRLSKVSPCPSRQSAL